ncbi:hypothetical protein V8D89_008490 [Ganoderma adspersum]
MELDTRCARCQNGVHLEYFPDSATGHKIYDAGEVYKGFGFRTISHSSLGSVTDGDYRVRPALLIKPRRVTKPTDSSIHSTVVLFATFEGSAPLRSDLPRVLQWFSIPVAPHSAIQSMTEKDDRHIHTYPEWSNSKRTRPGGGPVNSWLIARAYNSMGYVDGRWGNVNGTSCDSTFQVDWDTWEEILKSLEELWTSWLEKCCEGRNILEEYQREYLACLTTIAKKRAIAKAEKQKAVLAPARTGTSTTQQPAPMATPSLQAGPSQEIRQATQVTPSRSFASVLASGFKKKSVTPARPASTTVQTVNEGSLPVAKREPAVGRSTKHRIRSLFTPKDIVVEPSESHSTDTTQTPHLRVEAQRTHEQNVNESLAEQAMSAELVPRLGRREYVTLTTTTPVPSPAPLQSQLAPSGDSYIQRSAHLHPFDNLKGDRLGIATGLRKDEIVQRCEKFSAADSPENENTGDAFHNHIEQAGHHLASARPSTDCPSCVPDTTE